MSWKHKLTFTLFILYIRSLFTFFYLIGIICRCFLGVFVLFGQPHEHLAITCQKTPD